MWFPFIDATPGILGSCKCLFCYDCMKKLGANSIKACPICKSVLNFQKCINLKDKKDIEKIRYMFEDPEIQAEKFRQTLKFHETHQNRYIAFLENKIKSLLQENHNLRESINALHNKRAYVNK